MAKGHYYRKHHLPPFVPKTFDEALIRGRTMYEAGKAGSLSLPNNGYAVSDGDMASFELGRRHAKEFPDA